MSLTQRRLLLSRDKINSSIDRAMHLDLNTLKYKEDSGADIIKIHLKIELKISKESFAEEKKNIKFHIE